MVIRLLTRYERCWLHLLCRAAIAFAVRQRADFRPRRGGSGTPVTRITSFSLYLIFYPRRHIASWLPGSAASQPVSVYG